MKLTVRANGRDNSQFSSTFFLFIESSEMVHIFNIHKLN